jgi:ATP-dependent protease ClpP protease subunit
MKNRLFQLLASNVANGAGVRAETTAAGLEVMIYDVIDPWFGVSASSVAAVMQGAGDAPLTIRVNSPGGDAFEGRAIASLIRSYKGPTRCIVDGLAASAASTIAIAAQKTEMAVGSFLMIHNAWTVCMGDSEDLLETAAMLSKVDGELAADYRRKSGATLDECVAWMGAETWFTAEEAVSAGLADAVLSSAAQFSAFNLGGFERTPKALAERVAAAARPSVSNGPTAEELRASLERKLKLLSFA